MRYLKLFESFEDKTDKWNILKICIKNDIYDYTINPDGSIDVNGDVYLSGKKLTKIPLKFNKVNGYFGCSSNNLISLEGCPKEVNHGFSCYGNKLTSFIHAPKIISGGLDCDNNNIRSFEYFPSYVGVNFWCSGNPIVEIWILFQDTKKIELLNDFDMFRDEDTDTPSIIMDRLNDFLLTIGNEPVEKVDQYKNI